LLQDSLRIIAAKLLDEEKWVQQHFHTKKGDTHILHAMRFYNKVCIFWYLDAQVISATMCVSCILG
jgi:hypothetical protein